MPNYTGGVWRTIRGTHVFIRDGEDLETAFKRVKQKGYSDNDFKKQEEKIAQLRKEYRDLETRVGEYDDDEFMSGSPAHDESKWDLQDKEDELREARKKYGEMSKSPYVERKLKLGRENYDKLMGKTNDKEIEDSIKSLYIYQDEKNMGSLRENPLGKYYDKYGKENVDRVWKKMDDKYAVIKGTSMDSEGLRYNELVEKDKHSPEAIQYLQNRTEQAYKNYYGDSRKYNEEIAQAKAEFNNFKSHDSQIAETVYKQSVGDKKEFLRKMRQDYGWDNEDAKEHYKPKYKNLDEVIADRDSKLNRYINSKTPLEKMTRQQLAEYIVDDQISRGIVKEENRTMQVQGRLKGVGVAKAMSKNELYKGAKDIQLSKMSLSELRNMASDYGVETKGLSQKQLVAKLIAMFNK